MLTVKKVTNAKQIHKSYLEQTGGPDEGRTFELSRDILSIGRTDENEIVLKSESVSRCHAFLKKAASGEWLLQDNNSKNGIRVNGKRVLEYKLMGGDELTIGDYTFLFHECGTNTSLAMQGTEVVDLAAVKRAATPVAAVSPPKLEVPVAKAEVPLSVVHKPVRVAGPTFGQRARGSAARVSVFVREVERHSWVAGVLMGVAIGGALWYKANRSMSRPVPRQMAQAPQEKAQGRNPDAKPQRSEGRDIRDLAVYLRDGQAYLNSGDNESAIIAFRFALVLDPGNQQAIAGLKAAGAPGAPSNPAATPAAEAKAAAQTKPQAPPPAPKPAAKPTPSAAEIKARELARARAKVADLLKGAADSFTKRRYQEAINRAEQARKIEIPDQTAYLNEAKQIIDRAQIRQKEDFEPFLESALQKIEQGDFAASSALCEEMLRTDPTYTPAKQCLAKSVEAIASSKGGQ